MQLFSMLSIQVSLYAIQTFTFHLGLLEVILEFDYVCHFGHLWLNHSHRPPLGCGNPKKIHRTLSS